MYVCILYFYGRVEQDQEHRSPSEGNVEILFFGHMYFCKNAANNFIIDAEEITKLDLGEMKDMYIEEAPTNTISEDLRWILKTNSSKLKTIGSFKLMKKFQTSKE